MSLRRPRCIAPLLAASLSAMLAACALSGGETPGANLGDPALATKPSTAGAANETQQPAKTATRAEPPKTAARAEPPKTAARPEPAKTATRQEPAKTAARATPLPATPTETSACAEGGDCMAQLKRMVDGTNRTWVGRAEPPQQIADGTRLFAYRALRPNLNCRELGLALTEIDTSRKRLQDPASAISPDRVERVAALAADVAGELKTEHAGRCSSSGTRTTAAGADRTPSQ
jgi:hypothetical protein